MFIAVGVSHFVNPAFFIAIMPPYVPWHRELVLLSGVAEAALGVLVLPARTRRLATWGLIALLVAVFPANVHMALNPELFATIPSWLLWARLPLQGVMGWWVYGVGRAEKLKL